MLLTHNSRAGTKPNRDLLNRSAVIEIDEPVNNFRRRLVIVVPDPNHICDADVISEFLLQPYSDCTIGSVPPYAVVNILLRDLYFLWWKLLVDCVKAGRWVNDFKTDVKACSSVAQRRGPVKERKLSP